MANGRCKCVNNDSPAAMHSGSVMPSAFLYTIPQTHPIILALWGKEQVIKMYSNLKTVPRKCKPR